jgi:nitronate monooxygenase
MDALKTDFTMQFDVRYPIICAPMFLVSSVKMVVAACEAGGVGTFPALNYRPAEKYLQAIREIKGLTTKPFGINIIVQKSNKYQYQQIEYALAERVPLMITSLGNPKEAIKLAHQVGTKVYCDVIGLEHAKKVADLGADGLIAVGFGAGGHAGDISPFALIPNLAKKIKLPVIAAGSISDGAGMAAAFALGACAVYMGTRFIASQEAEVEQKYKNTIAAATCEDIVNTDKVDGFPGNFIRTPELEAIGLQKGLIEEILTKNKRIKRWVSLSRAARSLLGAVDSKASYKTVYSAGHGVGLIDEVYPFNRSWKTPLNNIWILKPNSPDPDISPKLFIRIRLYNS